MSYFLEFTSVVTYRVIIKDDGSAGTPEILSKFTSAPKKTMGAYKPKIKKQEDIQTLDVGEVEL